ncbi:2-dehydropantoate 2-reductase [Actinomyces bovis]|uniref:2-dehydropantoate 2-reductase n=1 Tax=Actinomyces bovis TaxID=1658 RepID=A0ABY1VSG5_9ACTO|nr:2-dehydropantoate 2-reductase N-terminal domain-containing protein [Actinomyces bovis]SPT53983.1 2-dehydropantoate 2-reductase [Actinomyces bovis]VEG53915.1 2-dehydropantoate 2-reductase [Actinomyces israelii]
MRVLLLGSGVIGSSYGLLLSRVTDVAVLARPERAEELSRGVRVTLRDPAGQRCRTATWRPKVLTVPPDEGHGPDLVLVSVDRTHLSHVLPTLRRLAGHAPILFMLNHWDITGQLDGVLRRSDYLLGFPGQVGGGRSPGAVDATLFPHGTVLERGEGRRRAEADAVGTLLTRAGLRVTRHGDLPGWLAVHYLQQSVTPGALAEAGGYDALVEDRRALRRMVLALREGLAVCRARGIRTGRIMPAPALALPTGLVAAGLGRMLGQEPTRRMVLGHMAHGLPEWRTGLRDVAESGRRLGVDMPVWWSYEEQLAEPTA